LYSVVFDIGFLFKLLVVTSLQTVFLFFFPLCPLSVQRYQSLRVYTKQAELVPDYVGIFENDTHMLSSSPQLRIDKHCATPMLYIELYH
jgi:hypothetical protein